MAGTHADRLWPEKTAPATVPTARAYSSFQLPLQGYLADDLPAYSAAGGTPPLADPWDDYLLRPRTPPTGRQQAGVAATCPPQRVAPARATPCLMVPWRCDDWDPAASGAVAGSTCDRPTSCGQDVATTCVVRACTREPHDAGSADQVPHGVQAHSRQRSAADCHSVGKAAVQGTGAGLTRALVTAADAVAAAPAVLPTPDPWLCGGAMGRRPGGSLTPHVASAPPGQCRSGAASCPAAAPSGAGGDATAAICSNSGDSYSGSKDGASCGTFPCIVRTDRTSLDVAPAAGDARASSLRRQSCASGAAADRAQLGSADMAAEGGPFAGAGTQAGVFSLCVGERCTVLTVTQLRQRSATHQGGLSRSLRRLASLPDMSAQARGCGAASSSAVPQRVPEDHCLALTASDPLLGLGTTWGGHSGAQPHDKPPPPSSAPAAATSTAPGAGQRRRRAGRASTQPVLVQAQGAADVGWAVPARVEVVGHARNADGVEVAGRSWDASPVAVRAVAPRTSAVAPVKAAAAPAVPAAAAVVSVVAKPDAAVAEQQPEGGCNERSTRQGSHLPSLPRAGCCLGASERWVLLGCWPVCDSACLGIGGCLAVACLAALVVSRLLCASQRP